MTFPYPSNVLLCPPDFFGIVDAKNPFMKNNLGLVDTIKAYGQWDVLKNHYQELKNRGVIEQVILIEPQSDLEDMVFAANQSF